MALAALVALSGSLPNFRSSLVSHVPDDFNAATAQLLFLKRIGSKTYTCYMHEHQTPSTDLPPATYLKQNLVVGSCFEYSATGYWYFSFCPFKELTQFRYAEDATTRIDRFRLAAEGQNTSYAVRGRSVVAEWGGGDRCVITKKPRTATIEYVCDMSVDRDGIIASISEPKFCHYLVSYHTRHACAFPNVTQEDLAIITCIRYTPTPSPSRSIRAN
jgi:protein OS-9